MASDRKQNTQSFMTMGMRMRGFGQRIMRKYNAPDPGASESSARPVAAWRALSSEPITWQQPAPAPVQRVPELPTILQPEVREDLQAEWQPQAGQVEALPAPATSPSKVDPAPVQRKPEPKASVRGAKPKKDIVDPDLRRVFDAHMARKAEQDAVREQRMEVARQAEASGAPKRKRRASFDYVATAALTGDEPAASAAESGKSDASAAKIDRKADAESGAEPADESPQEARGQPPPTVEPAATTTETAAEASSGVTEPTIVQRQPSPDKTSGAVKLQSSADATGAPGAPAPRSDADVIPPPVENLVQRESVAEDTGEPVPAEGEAVDQVFAETRAAASQAAPDAEPQRVARQAVQRETDKPVSAREPSTVLDSAGPPVVASEIPVLPQAVDAAAPETEMEVTEPALSEVKETVQRTSTPPEPPVPDVVKSTPAETGTTVARQVDSPQVTTVDDSRFAESGQRSPDQPVKSAKGGPASTTEVSPSPRVQRTTDDAQPEVAPQVDEPAPGAPDDAVMVAEMQVDVEQATRLDPVQRKPEMPQASTQPTADPQPDLGSFGPKKPFEGVELRSSESTRPEESVVQRQEVETPAARSVAEKSQIENAAVKTPPGDAAHAPSAQSAPVVQRPSVERVAPDRTSQAQQSAHGAQLPPAAPVQPAPDVVQRASADGATQLGVESPERIGTETVPGEVRAAEAVQREAQTLPATDAPSQIVSEQVVQQAPIQRDPEPAKLVQSAEPAVEPTPESSAPLPARPAQEPPQTSVQRKPDDTATASDDLDVFEALQARTTGSERDRADQGKVPEVKRGESVRGTQSVSPVQRKPLVDDAAQDRPDLFEALQAIQAGNGQGTGRPAAAPSAKAASVQRTPEMPSEIPPTEAEPVGEMTPDVYQALRAMGALPPMKPPSAATRRGKKSSSVSPTAEASTAVQRQPKLEKPAGPAKQDTNKAQSEPPVSRASQDSVVQREETNESEDMGSMSYGGIDVDRLARDVERVIRARLRNERDRRG